MNQYKDLLLEIGTEELPPLALQSLGESLLAGMLAGLKNLGLEAGESIYFATPRRLAVRINQLPLQQPPQKIQRRGPAESAAFNVEGRPTPPAEGFARSCGVDIAELQRVETDKGRFLYYEMEQAGRDTAECLPEIIKQALAALPIPKRMRWGSSDVEFVRPVHWVLLLLGETLVPTDILGLRTGRETRGHRFHAPEPISIKTPADYKEKLFEQGKIIVDFAERRETIRTQIELLAKKLKGQVRLAQNEGLLSEVTALVEWPVAISGSFDARFLQVPLEVLVETMQVHQKYFPVFDMQGKLSRHFITISNIESQNPERIREGNERVIRPRLADAAFFWEQDIKVPLAQYNNLLKDVIFQKKLGSLQDKVLRIVQLTGRIAVHLNGDSKTAIRAAELCKADLMTSMVGEFPKLQGIMGRYFALAAGETETVASAIEEHYHPRYAGDRIPHSVAGQSVAIADKLDTLVGIFAIGQKPSGVKDPFGLRRAAIGVLRIIIDGNLDLDLYDLIRISAETFSAELGAAHFVDEVFDYILSRLPGEYEQEGFSPQQIQAVISLRPVKPFDFDKRIRAVKAFTQLPEAESLSAADKRIRNILKKVDDKIPQTVDATLLLEGAEKELHQSLTALSAGIADDCAAYEYEKALMKLASLKAPVDRFFEDVMVMTDDSRVKANRLALLTNLREQFLHIADISCLQNT